MSYLNNIVDQIKPKILRHKYLSIAIGSFIALIIARRIYKKRQIEAKRRSYPRDVVILHQFPRGLHAPSPSPFALKVETWLRINNIKYQNEFGIVFGPKGKIPFITYNGEDICDSDFIIEYLSKKLNIDLSNRFSSSDLGVARAFSKMTEESLFWIMSLHRFVWEKSPENSGFPRIALYVIGNMMSKRSKSQGYGLHSREEVYSIGRKDLKSLNDFLEGKKFLLGDTPCNEDSTIFGMMCQILYHEKGPMNKFILNECPHILLYVENMKNTFWPDWYQCIRYKKN